MKNKLLLSIALFCGSFSFAQLGFNISNYSGCKPLKETFKIYSSPFGSNFYKWYFGTGDSASTGADSINYTYTQNGNFNPYVTAYDTTNHQMQFLGTSYYEGSINVNGSQMNTSGDSACVNEMVTAYIYPGNGSNNWDFGDGYTVSNQGEASHAYSSPGTYTISCAYYNYQCNKNDTVTKLVMVGTHVKPSANFYLNNNTGCPHDVFSFNPQNQNAVSYFWTFGDGGTSTQEQPTHSFDSIGHFPVTLTITSICGQNSSTDTVFISNHIYFPSYVGINVPPKACPGELVNFNNNITPIRQVWKFGNGDSSTAYNPSYAYPSLGTYTVTCKMTNGCGNDTVLSASIVIGRTGWSNNNNINYNVSPTSLCPGDIMNYNVNTAAKAYKWNFGDSDSSSTTQGNYSYSKLGLYTITLTLTNNCGVDTVITISPAITVTNGIDPILSHDGNNNNWGALMDSACVGDSTIFYAFQGAHYFYDFGDSTTTTKTYPYVLPGMGQVDLVKHAYHSVGTKKIKLTYYNRCDNSATDSLYVVIGVGQPVHGGIVKTGGPNTVYTACAPVPLIASGGNSFQWKFGDGDSLNTSQPAILHTYLKGGTFHVSLKVTNACGNFANYTDSVVVQGMSLNTTVTEVTCYGGADGGYKINVTAGTPPYAYSYNGGPSTFIDSASGLSAITYTVSVTDANSCITSTVININSPTAMVLTPSITQPSCKTKNGSVTVDVTGDTPGYSYMWSSKANTKTVSGLGAGIYTLTVTDSKGCTGVSLVTLNNSSAPILTVNPIVNLACSYSNNCSGSAMANASSGSFPYTYTWSSGSTKAQGTGLCVGSNYVTVTDHLGCQVFSDVEITQPSALLDTIMIQQIGCANANKGIATANVSGGTGVYTYSWSNGGTSATINDLAPASYVVTVTDANGCISVKTTTLPSAGMPAYVPICMVTVDTLSQHNVVLWEKPLTLSIDSFIIYRETTSNNYRQIGAQPYSALSQFVDTVQHKYFPYTGDPNGGTYRYKLQVRDTCGNYSSLSPYHNTIYITQGVGGSFSWFSYTIEGQPSPLPSLISYDLYRADSTTSKFVLINSVAGTQNTIADPNYLKYLHAKYYVATNWGISCTPTLRIKAAIIVNSSRSNIKNNDVLFTGTGALGSSFKFEVFPNPANDKLHINLPGNSSGYIAELLNMLGERVSFFQINGASADLELSGIASGVYYLKVYDTVNSIAGQQKVVVAK